MRVQPLAGRAEPWQVVRALATRAARLGIPPPAALSGDWFGGEAVLVPSVRIAPVTVDEVQARLAAAAAGAASTVGGGWIGYLGYGLGDPRPADRRLPLAVAGWTDVVLRRSAGRWCVEWLAEPSPWLIGELAALVAGADSVTGGTFHCHGLRPTDPEQHRRAVAHTKEQIAAGEIYQANICIRLEATLTGRPSDVFAAGLRRWGPRRAALLEGEWGAVASFSPELFLARHGRTVLTAPIKGTRPRRDGSAEGADELRRSVKDIAENIMIVDMARNDLARVCRPGTVRTRRLLDLQPHPGVWHLVSEVTGELCDGMDDAALLQATFPPASVTGTPKSRALEVIDDVEAVPREVYCGAIGFASPVAGTELSVAIRTCEFQAGRVWFGVGGGITADSDPDAEWDECMTKAAPLLDLLGSGS